MVWSTLLLAALAAAPAASLPVQAEEIVADWRRHPLPPPPAKPGWLLQRVDVSKRTDCTSGRCLDRPGELRADSVVLYGDEKGRPEALSGVGEVWRVRERDASGAPRTYVTGLGLVRLELGPNGELRDRRYIEDGAGVPAFTCTWKGKYIGGPSPSPLSFPFAVHQGETMYPPVQPEALSTVPRRPFSGVVECREDKARAKFLYDAEGRLASSESGPLVQTRRYDDQGRLIGITGQFKGPLTKAGGSLVLFVKEATLVWQGSRLVSWTASLGKDVSSEIQYDYDDIGRLIHQRQRLDKSVIHSFWQYPR